MDNSAPARVPSQTEKADMWPLYIMIAATWAVIFIAGYYLQSRISGLEASQTQVVVADVGGIAQLFPYLDDPDDVNDVMARMDEVLATMAEAGYVVINRQAVLDAPDHLRIPSDFILEQAGIRLSDFTGAEAVDE